MTESSRSKTLEVMARAQYAANCWWRIVEDDDDGLGRYKAGHENDRFRAIEWEQLPADERKGLLDAAEAALTAYESHLQAEGMAVVPGWQPIETKPRDHFPVLVWSERIGQVVAFLDVTWTWWPCPAIEPLSSAPTHWRPLLPASPYGKAVVKEGSQEPA